MGIQIVESLLKRRAFGPGVVLQLIEIIHETDLSPGINSL